MWATSKAHWLLNIIWILALLHYPGYHYCTLSYCYPIIPLPSYCNPDGPYRFYLTWIDSIMEHTQTLIRFYHFTVEGDEFCYVSYLCYKTHLYFFCCSLDCITRLLIYRYSIVFGGCLIHFRLCCLHCVIIHPETHRTDLWTGFSFTSKSKRKEFQEFCLFLDNFEI